MNENNQKSSRSVRFRRFTNCPYAVFRSLKNQVNIGVLTIPMLAVANLNVASAQTDNQVKEKMYEMEEVEVTGSRTPLTVSQAARLVTVLDREAIANAPAQSVNDLLKYAIGVDVRQRGNLGAQTDISIRGGSFDQITILLNGINICDPQTGHNAAEFPVDITEIERIEILEGPAGRVYGTSSLMGAINIVTRIDKQSGAAVHAEGGSYGYFNGGGHASVVSGKFSNQVSGSYTRSDGFSRNKAGGLNADFKQSKGFYQGNYRGDQVDVKWYAGISSKDFGSNTFYGVSSDDQFEHTRKFHTAVQAETKGQNYHFKPSVYWNRGEDRFEYFRGKGENTYNYGRTDVLGLNLNNYVETVLGKTAFGAEFRNEGIISTKLGEPLDNPTKIHGVDRDYDKGLNRTNMSFHLEHTVILPRFTLSAGVIATKNTWDGEGFKFYPGVDVSYQLARDWKIYASYNTSLRLPSFTELYYTMQGYKADKHLKAEKMQAFEGGIKYLTPGVKATVSVYRNHGTNMIDWIRDTSKGEDEPWQSVNHTKLNTTGVEASVLFDFRHFVGKNAFVKDFNVSYSYIDKDKESEPNIVSQYALEYLKHKVVAQTNLRLYSKLNLNISYRWQDRIGNYTTDGKTMSYKPYTLLDARLSWDAKQYRLFAEANNILNKTYYDHGNVPQPGIWVRAGATYRFNF